ncbi:uncharacterized protein PRCAT00002261001 [Priceomyces carsonii]|uniref:uncharacterized protein n=1 Tax=Priceomyces carsonii TaxID=28549 RepID=UPI002ED9E7E7|nr:unnamed protein product [Priceomyces carsonii]
MSKIPIIVIGTLVLGALNSLFTKYQDNQCVKNCENPDLSTHRYFEQPAVQTLQMFLGELGIFFVYYLCYKSPFSRRQTGMSTETEAPSHLKFGQSIKLSIPAILDLTATSLMNIGLLYIPVSIYQMTRGAVVLFVAILSVLFLQTHVRKLEWVALAFVTLGVALVGFSGTTSSGPSDDNAAPKVVFGIVLVILAVSLQALQFVAEEHILKDRSIVPLKVVYNEGFYGTIILTFFMIVLNYIFAAIYSEKQFENSPFNLRESFSQVFKSKEIIISSIFIMISISTFNFCGVSITHMLSATARTTIDTCRTLVVWLVALILGWESFSFLQCFGFALLVFGTLCFNGALTPEDWEFVPIFLKERDFMSISTHPGSLDTEELSP